MHQIKTIEKVNYIKFILLVSVFCCCTLSNEEKIESIPVEKKIVDNEILTDNINYLALGDSYTIGEGVDEKDIHPSNKKDVGERFACIALVDTYGIKGITPTGPLYKNKTLYPTYIDLSFEHVGDGLVGKENLQGFEIAGMNGEFYKAKASIVGDKVRVKSSKVTNPQRVRYGWKNYFKATLYNKDGLPASSFDTN